MELFQLASIQIAALEQRERAATEGTIKDTVSLRYIRDISSVGLREQLTGYTVSLARAAQIR